MSFTTTTHDDHDHGHGHGPAVEGAENPGGHHEPAELRDHKERLALWMFIAGDALFLILMVFTWFYLRTLNSNGMWDAAQCSTANPCEDGLGNPILAQITRADPWHAVIIAACTVLAAGFVWLAEIGAKKNTTKAAISGPAGMAFLFMVLAIAMQIYQFQVLPFTTIDGAYASTYEFFMGSTLAHLLILAFVGLGLWIRSTRGRHAGGTWYRVRLIRFFAVWVALSTVILTVVGALFA